MSWWHRLKFIVYQLDRTRAERDLEDEIKAHLEIEASEQAERGTLIGEARFAARRSFGNVTSTREECRQHWSLVWLGTTVQDLRYAMRTLGRDWAVVAVVVASIAFAVGANTAVFSIVDAVFFRPLPGVVEPERIISLYGDDQTTPQPDWASIAYPEFSMFRGNNSAFRDIAAYCRLPFNLTADAATEPVIGELVSEAYFEVLGARPAQGRTLRTADFATGAPLTAVVSLRLWKRLGGDSSLTGRNLQINGHPARIVGIAEEEFGGLLLDWYGRADVWLPLASHEGFFGRDMSSSYSPWLMVAGRLADNADISQVQTDLSYAAEQVREIHPARNKDRSFTAVPSGQARFWPGHKDSIGRLLASLAATGGLVLIIACVNGAGLLLARAANRRREIAVRLALGASYGRVVGQLLTELGPLILAATFLGLLLAWGIIESLSAFEHPFRISLDLQPELDLRVLTFAFIASFLATTLAGILPSASLARGPAAPSIGRVVSMWRSGTNGLGLKKLLLVTQVSIAAVVLMGAGLFVQSLSHVYAVDPGFAVENIVVAEVRTGVYRDDNEDIEGFYRNLVQRSRSVPGVESVALAEDLVLTTIRRETTVEIPLSGENQIPGELRIPATRVSARYFETLDIATRLGESPTASSWDLGRDIVINQSLADRFWENENPVGRVLKVGGADAQVLAVVEDIHDRDLFEPPRPHLYRSFAGRGSAFVLVRHHGNPTAILQAIKQEVRQLDGSVAVSGLTTMQQHIDRRLSGQRLLASFTGFLGIGVLLLAAAGIFSLASLIVTQGQREIGIRKALGEEPRSIAARILGQGLRYCVTGMMLGVIVAACFAGAIEDQLFQTSPNDPIVFVGVGILLVATTLAACYLPARHAANVDPIRTLRQD